MAFGFARQSGGQLRIDSELGRGTTVELLLPRAELNAAIAVRSDAVAEVDWNGCDALVLIVGDDPAVRQLASTMVSQLGCRVLSASDGATALELLDRNPEVRLLFTDVVLSGGLDGFELADRARERSRELRVLFSSGYTGNEPSNGGPPTGDPFRPKPYQRRDLTRMLSRLLDGP